MLEDLKRMRAKSVDRQENMKTSGCGIHRVNGEFNKKDSGAVRTADEYEPELQYQQLVEAGALGTSVY